MTVGAAHRTGVTCDYTDPTRCGVCGRRPTGWEHTPRLPKQEAQHPFTPAHLPAYWDIGLDGQSQQVIHFTPTGIMPCGEARHPEPGEER